MMPAGTSILVGIAASPGIAIGRCWSVDRRRVRTPKRRLGPDEVEGELARFRTALDVSDLQLAEVKEKVERADGAAGTAEHTAIIDMHRMMLRDEMLVHEAQRLVRDERLNAEWAVKRAVRKIKSAFHEQADEYFKERRADVDYVGERIIKNLLGQAPDVDEAPPEGAIIVAHDLSPADTALLLHDRKVAAFVTDAGAKTSHTAIVARALEVPAVVGVGRITSLVERGDWIVVDGSRGVVVINPTPAERSDYEAARERYRVAEEDLLRTRDLGAHEGRSHRAGGREHRVRRGGPEPPLARRRGGRPVPDRVPLPRALRPPFGGGALPELPQRPRGARAASRHDPDVRSRRRQAALGHARARRQPGARPAGDPLLPPPPRTLPGAAARAAPRLGPWEPQDHVPDDLRGRGAALGAPRPRGGPCGARPDRGPDEEGHPGRHHDRAAERRADRGPARARVRLLLHRNERPHPVHDRDRPAEQGRRVPVQAAPPRGAADARPRLRRRTRGGDPGVDVRRDGGRARERARARRASAA